MFSLKRSLIAFLLFLLLYVLLMVGGDLFLNHQKNAIEKAFEKQFPGATLTIGKLYNLPFGFIGAKDVTFSLGLYNNISIKQVRFFYLPSIFWDGIEAVYQITIQEADGKIAPNELLTYMESFSQNLSSQKIYPKIVFQKELGKFSFKKAMSPVTNIFLKIGLFFKKAPRVVAEKKSKFKIDVRVVKPKISIGIPKIKIPQIPHISLKKPKLKITAIF
ncbi:MAG: hypothetical protein ACK4TN_06475, partial [Brevinematales bacterium]